MGRESPEEINKLVQAATNKGGRLCLAHGEYLVSIVSGGVVIAYPDGYPIAVASDLAEAAKVISDMVAAAEKAQAIMDDAMAAMSEEEFGKAILFKIEKRGDKYVVLDAAGEKVLGTHDTEEAAKKQLAAIEANKSKMAQMKKKRRKVQYDVEKFGQLYETEVEIMAVGTWNGYEFDRSDLEQIVRDTNAKIGYLKPPLKLGHDDEQRIVQNSGLPSIGWIEQLSLVGDRIVAKCKGIPEQVYKLLGKAYRRVSCELLLSWPDPETGRRMRVLSGLALLGADTPAVSTLQDILGLYGEEFRRTPEDGAVIVFDYEPKEEEIVEKDKEKEPKPEMVSKAAFDEAVARWEKSEKLRVASVKKDAQKRSDELIRFATDKATMRILPKSAEALKAVLARAVEDQVACFSQEQAEDKKTLLDDVDELIRGLPELTAMFQERAVDAEGKPGARGKVLTEAEAVTMAAEIETKEKVPFQTALRKVYAENKVKMDMVQTVGGEYIRLEAE